MESALLSAGLLKALSQCSHLGKAGKAELQILLAVGLRLCLFFAMSSISKAKLGPPLTVFLSADILMDRPGRGCSERSNAVGKLAPETAVASLTPFSGALARLVLRVIAATA